MEFFKPLEYNLWWPKYTRQNFALMPSIPEALTYDDVLIVPKRSAIQSRGTIATCTRLSRGLEINIPIITANMDTVTESAMAIVMARLGGLGVLHRFMTIEENAAEVRRVKRAESFAVENPYAMHPNSTVAQARVFMEERGISGILITTPERRLLGIVARRDILFEDNNQKKLAEVMTPRSRLIVGSPATTLSEARRILHEHHIEKLPIVDSEDRVLALITAQDLENQTRYPLAVKDKKGRLMVGGSIGVTGDYLERARALKEAGADILVIDIAHGHSDLMIEALKKVRDIVGELPLMAGNVCTPRAVEDLCAAGADAVKVGVGPGATCTTRLVTGCGVPQLHTVMTCAQAAAKYGIPIIADGGIQKSGDIIKAIGAGAHCVMSGGLFAGTTESPGEIMISGDKKFKVCRGSSSFAIAERRKKLLQEKKKLEEVVPEGVESVTPYKGDVKDVVAQLIGGLKSGMSYCNAQNIEELRGQVEFVKITEAGRRESGSHDLLNAKGSYT